MGRRERMTWICNDMGQAVFPNDCPLETGCRQMPTKDEVDEVKQLLDEIGE